MKALDTIHDILAVLYTAEYRRLANWIDKICHQNQEAYGDPELVGFVHMGKVYKPLDCKEADHVIKRRGLHDSLTGDMDTYLLDLSILQRDKSFIHQALFGLLNPCTNLQEVRDALPECLVDTLPALKGMGRHGDEAWTLKDSPRALKQFEKIKPRIEMYAVTRLIY